MAQVGIRAVAVNGKIFAIGITSPNSIDLSSFNDEYDPANNTWTLKAPMPTNRTDFATATFNGKIYCLGGRSTTTVNAQDKNYALADNEVYDPANDTWQTLTPLLKPVVDIDANVVNDKIYLIGHPERTS